MSEEILVSLILMICALLVLFVPFALLVPLPLYLLIRRGRFSLGRLMAVIGCIALYFALLAATAGLSFVP